MIFIYTPTTAFELLDFQSMVQEIRCCIEPSSRFHAYLLHHVYVGEFMGVPPSLCTNINALFGVQDIQDKGHEGSLSCQVKSNFAQVLSFRSKSDPVTGVPVIYCRVNMWIMREDAPPGVVINELVSIPASLNRVQTNIVNFYCSLFSAMVSLMSLMTG
jgi:hypothetical protein